MSNVCCSVLIVIGLYLSTVSAQAATVSTFAGEQLTGELTVSDEQTLEVAGQQLALSACDWIEFSAGEATNPRSDELPSVILADGGWLAAQGIAPAGPDRLRLWTPTGELDLALGEMVAWGPTGWLQSTSIGDSDIVIVDGEQFIGTVTGLRDGKLFMVVDGLGENEIMWDRVSAFWLAVPMAKLTGNHLEAVMTAGQAPVALMFGALPRLAIAPAQTLQQWPSGRLRVLSPRRVWLEDVTPSHVTEAGAFEVVWPYQVRQNLDGGPIELDGQRYRHGLVVHSRAEIVWPLGGDFERFQAVIGIEDTVGLEGDCDVRLLVDGEVRWQTASLRGDQAATEVAFDCRGGQELVLQIEFGARYDIADHVALADAYLVRSVSP